MQFQSKSFDKTNTPCKDLSPLLLLGGEYDCGDEPEEDES